MEKEGKFYAGFYKNALMPRIAKGASSIESENYVGNITFVETETIDVEAVKKAFSRDELITRGFLKTGGYDTLKIAKKPSVGSKL